MQTFVLGQLRQVSTTRDGRVNNEGVQYNIQIVQGGVCLRTTEGSLQPQCIIDHARLGRLVSHYRVSVHRLVDSSASTASRCIAWRPHNTRLCQSFPSKRACNLSEGNSLRTNNHSHSRESRGSTESSWPLESCINSCNTFVTSPATIEQLPTVTHLIVPPVPSALPVFARTILLVAKPAAFAHFINSAFVQCDTRSLYYSFRSQPISARCCQQWTPERYSCAARLLID